MSFCKYETLKCIKIDKLMIEKSQLNEFVCMYDIIYIWRRWITILLLKIAMNEKEDFIRRWRVSSESHSEE